MVEHRKTKLEQQYWLYQLNKDVEELERWITEREAVASSTDLGQDLEGVTVSAECGHSIRYLRFNDATVTLQYISHPNKQVQLNGDRNMFHLIVRVHKSDFSLANLKNFSVCRFARKPKSLPSVKFSLDFIWKLK